MSQYQAIPQFTFSGGELSPKVERRIDLEKYLSGLKLARNMIIERHGGVKSRQGTLYIANTPSNGAGRLVPFKRASNSNLMMEFTDSLIRFYEDGALLGAPSPVTVVSPWSASEIDALRFTQSGDVVYITHPSYKPRKLSRTAAQTFTLAEVGDMNGPFFDENVDDSKTIQASDVTGTVTLTASGHTPFTADHVGSVWRLRWQDRSDYAKWEGQVNFVVDTKVISRGKAYNALNGSTTGVNAPDHTEGSEFDGPTNRIEWEYLHSGYAYVTITAFTSSAEVEATVWDDSEIPADVVSAGTKYWSEPAISDEVGWPETVGFFNDRLVFTRLNEIYMSQPDDYENFSPVDAHGDVTAASAMRLVLSDSQANSIRWTRQVQDVLLVGTTGAEYAIGAASGSEPFGPDNAFSSPQSFHGSADFIQPIGVNEAVLFVSRNCKRLYEITAQEVTTRYGTAEMSILADHLLKDCVFEADYSESPEGIYWAITNLGQLIGMTYEPNQNIVAWHQHTIGGEDAFVESVAVIPHSDEAYDEVYLLVARTVNGSLERHVERMATPFEDVSEIADGVFLDAAQVDTGVSLSSVTVSHLAGNTVDCLIDGVPYTGLTASSSGVVTLPRTGSKVITGLGFDAMIRTLVPDARTGVGSGIGKHKGMPTLYIAFEQTNHCEHSLDGVNYNQIHFAEVVQTLDDPIPLFDGIKVVDAGMNFEIEPTLWLKQSLPLPLTIRVIAWDAVASSR